MFKLMKTKNEDNDVVFLSSFLSSTPTLTASASSLQSVLTSSSTSQLSNSNNSHQINSSSTARRKLFPAIENNHNVC